MTINDQIRDEKLEYDINREAASVQYVVVKNQDLLKSRSKRIIKQFRR